MGPSLPKLKCNNNDELHSCKSIPVAEKPANRAYPEELKSLGDHLWKVRIDRGLSQPGVAELLMDKAEPVTGWELNLHTPTAKMFARIIKFIGYSPFNTTKASIGTKLLHARMILGNTQYQVALALPCDESNLRYIELIERTPSNRIRSKILNYVTKTLDLGHSCSDIQDNSRT